MRRKNLITQFTQTAFVLLSTVIVLCTARAESRMNGSFEAEKAAADNAFSQGLFTASERHFLSALNFAKEESSQREEAEALAGLTNTSLALKDISKREDFYRRTLLLVKQISNSGEHDPEIKVAIADLYDHFLVHARNSNSDEEKMLFVDHAVRLKTPIIIAARQFDKKLLSNLALLASYSMTTDHLKDAEEYQKLVLSLFKFAPRNNQTLTEVRAAYNALGNIQTLEKKYDQAEYSYALQLQLCGASEQNSWWDAGSAHMSLANAFLEHGNYVMATAHAKVGTALLEGGLGQQSDVLSLDYYILGLAQEKLGQTDNANNSFRKSIATSQNKTSRSFAKELAIAHLNGSKVPKDKKAELFFRLWTFPVRSVNLTPVS